MRAEVPLHPSYEDRPGAPDRVFAALGDDVFEHHVHAWARALAGADAMDVLHLHHLTPINEAAARVAPDVPVVGHLHGTELLMLEAIEDDPGRWAHGPAWAERLRGVGGALRAADRALGQPGRARRAPARRRPGALRARRQRLRPGHLHAAPRRPPRALAARAGRGAARLGAGRGGGLRALRGGRPRRLRRRPRRDAGAALRRPLHRGQAPVAADRGLRGRPRRASTGAPRWCSSAASRASGRASTRWRRSAAPAPATSSWPAGTTTPSCPTSSPPPTSSCCRRCASSSARCSWRAARAGSRRSPSTRYGPAEIVRDGETGRLVPPDDREALAAALVEAVNDPQERRRRGVLAAEDARAPLRLAGAGRARRGRLRRRARLIQSASCRNARRVGAREAELRASGRPPRGSCARCGRSRSPRGAGRARAPRAPARSG